MGSYYIFMTGKALAFVAVLLCMGSVAQCFKVQPSSLVSQSLQVPEATFNYTKLLWPLPSKLSLNQTGEETVVDPCKINYKIEATPSDYVKQLLNIYLLEVFHCSEIKPAGNITVSIVVKNPNQMVAEQLAHEKYSITVRLTDKWDITADYYVGFLRALETFSQLFESKNGHYVINHRPILIDDQPTYLWRGLMIDSSRHFLSVDAIKHQIDALMYNKMSVLHWHITDEDSFPLEVQSRPELSQYGQFSGSYTRAQVRAIVNYGKIRGVRVIPQIDSPAHTQSWGRSEQLKDIVVKCNNQYEGQFDPTLNLTYDIVKDVLTEVNNTFIDGYVHMGGDEINEDCYTKKPSIHAWMDQNGIPTYEKLSEYYRKRQKQIWRNISTFKKAIYWANEQIDMPVDADDVIHWWGTTKSLEKLAGRKNEVILSNYDLTYLDLGFGGRRGSGYGHWISWRDLYAFDPQVKNVNVIGGQVCMWSQISNAEVQDQKVWPRASVLNERLWNLKVDKTKDILNIAERLISHNRRMKERGIKTSPVTVGLCERDPSICWGKG